MNNMNINTKSYDKIADQWDRARRMRALDPIIAHFADMLKKSAHVLDIGCGTGYPIDQFLCENGFSVTGIDPSGNMLKKAIELSLPNSEFFKTDLLSFKTDQTFDAAIAFDSIFHIDLQDQRKIYPKISSLLNPGGLFLFTHGRETGAVEGEMFGEKFVYSALDEEEIRRIFEKEDLKIIERYIYFSDPVTGTRDLVVIARKKI